MRMLSVLLDLLYKNVLQRQDPYEIAFKDVSIFDKENPIIESLLTKIEGGKLTGELVKKCLNSTPSIKDLEIQQRLENLKKSNRLCELEAATKITKNLNDDYDSCSYDEDGFLPALSTFLPSPPSFD